MPAKIKEIAYVDKPVQGTIRLPGSKSITNRALLMAAIADGPSLLHGALQSDDTRVMMEGLQKLGVEIKTDWSNRKIEVSGVKGEFPRLQADLHVDNSGTTIRFLTAALGVAGGRYRLDGIDRMRERPIGPLVSALSDIGVNIRAISPDGCPPVVIDSARVEAGRVQVKGDLSSQYLSGLLMAAPLARQGLTVEIVGELISKPYVQMTLEMMQAFSVAIEVNSEMTEFLIPGGQGYLGREYSIEPDASAASYFWAAAAICGGTAKVVGLNHHSLQGDVRFVDALERMGCRVDEDQDSISVTGPALRGIDIDMSDISDTVQTLSVVALFAQGKTRIRNVAHNRIKETDRIGNLAIELRKLLQPGGGCVEEFADGLEITPGPLKGAEIETYNDHRMAMSLALAGLRIPGVSINNPGCVAKTFPNYFEELEGFCGISNNES